METVYQNGMLAWGLTVSAAPENNQQQGLLELGQNLTNFLSANEYWSRIRTARPGEPLGTITARELTKDDQVISTLSFLALIHGSLTYSKEKRSELTKEEAAKVYELDFQNAIYAAMEQNPHLIIKLEETFGFFLDKDLKTRKPKLTKRLQAIKKLPPSPLFRPEQGMGYVEDYQ